MIDKPVNKEKANSVWNTEFPRTNLYALLYCIYNRKPKVYSTHAISSGRSAF